MTEAEAANRDIIAVLTAGVVAAAAAVGMSRALWFMPEVKDCNLTNLRPLKSILVAATVARSAEDLAAITEKTAKTESVPATASLSSGIEVILCTFY